MLPTAGTGQLPLYAIPQKSTRDRIIEISLIAMGILVILASLGLALRAWSQGFSLGAYLLSGAGVVFGIPLVLLGIYQKALINRAVHSLESASSNNLRQKKLIGSIRVGAYSAAKCPSIGNCNYSTPFIFKPGWREEEVGRFSITTTNYQEVCNRINEAIDLYTQNSDLVFVHPSGEIINGRGEITVLLTLLVKEKD